MKKKLAYNNRLRIFFQPSVWGLAFGIVTHDHSLDPYGLAKDFRSWKIAIYILCFEVQVFLWKHRKEIEGHLHFNEVAK